MSDRLNIVIYRKQGYVAQTSSLISCAYTSFNRVLLNLTISIHFQCCFIQHSIDNIFHHWPDFNASLTGNRKFDVLK